MGVYLSRPKTNKESFDGGHLISAYGVTSMQGWRKHMEDSFMAHPSLQDGKSALYGVFDGHGGAAVSGWISEHFLEQFESNYNAVKSKLKTKEIKIDDNVPCELNTAILNYVEDCQAKKDRSDELLSGSDISDVYVAEREDDLVLPDEDESPVMPSELSEEIIAYCEALQQTFLTLDQHMQTDQCRDELRNIHHKLLIGNEPEESEHTEGSMQSGLQQLLQFYLTGGKNGVTVTLVDGEDGQKCLKVVSEDEEEEGDKEGSLGQEARMDFEECDENGKCLDALQSEPCDKRSKFETWVDDLGQMDDSSNDDEITENRLEAENQKKTHMSTAQDLGFFEEDTYVTASTAAATSDEDAVIDFTKKQKVSPSEEDTDIPKLDPKDPEDTSTDLTVSFESMDADSEEEEEDEDSIHCVPLNPMTTDFHSLNDDEDSHQNNKGPLQPYQPECCGSTAVVAVIVDSPESPTLIVANAGDSRCVLSRNGIAIPVSRDHKPNLLRETQRIKAAGGKVQQGRVDGNLNLSRSIGDLAYKFDASRPQEAQRIISFPDIRLISINRQDEFAILACDGIWDCITNQELVNYIRFRLKVEREKARCESLADDPDKSVRLSKICEEICDKCIASSPGANDGVGCDNMTILIVLINDYIKEKKDTVDKKTNTSIASVADKLLSPMLYTGRLYRNIISA